MDTPETDRTVDESTPATQAVGDVNTGVAETKSEPAAVSKQSKVKTHAKHHGRHKKSKQSRKKSKKDHASSSESSDDSDSSDSSSSDDDDDDEDTAEEKSKRKSKKRRAQSNRKRKAKKKPKKQETDSDSSDSSDDDSSDSTSDRKPKRRGKKRSSRRTDDEEVEDESDGSQGGADDQLASMRRQLSALQMQLMMTPGGRAAGGRSRGGRGLGRAGRRISFGDAEDRRREKKKPKKAKKASTLEFKRVDQLWDNTIHNYKLQESAEDQEDEFDEYIFTVRRRFDWENKYKHTVVDIKSKLLRECLQEIMKDVRGISLVEDKPSIDPNMLFLYLEELRTYTKKTLKAKSKSEKKRRNRRKIKNQIAHCKVMLKYLDEDYKETKKTLYPMLEAGNITFDLLWALFKPDTIAYTPTYGSVENPRCFKVDYANKESSFMRGEWYCIEGRYLEYDGKSYGLGDFEVDVDAFKGARKITSLATYPLKYHQDPEAVRTQLIERGKRFVSMEGMNYRFHHGLAFVKKKKTVAKVNINGRIMIDPATFRRINPNYPISIIKPKETDNLILPRCDSDTDDDGCSCRSGDESDGGGGDEALGSREDQQRMGFKVVEDPDRPDHYVVVEVPIDEEGNVLQSEKIDVLPDSSADDAATAKDARQPRVFTDEELLIASPVVLGFAFSEKLWLEFSISGVRDIDWNEGAFDSLVLPAAQKSIVRALVESHKFHAARTIDDVVQGKGRGLVAVLHGPPGTGKTLTAEGIAELLRCPLYMVSAGELGTDPRTLEAELQKILDIAHAWGAVLLLDEADVFLERREAHDIHRNALVSIFLRLLEYFQGILFLTTNRVETFDDAFQSRIHVALRYGELALKARRAVWKMFLDKVGGMEAAAAAAAAAVEPAKDATSASASTPASTTSADASKSIDASKPTAEDKPTNDNKPAAAPLPPAFSEADYDALARRALNGRQIKNSVRTAQALAVNEGARMGMEHVRRVLDVAESFERDLKGGSGYDDAMRSYT